MPLPHCADKETEAQRREVAWQGSPRGCVLSFCVSFIISFFFKKNLYFLVALRLSCGAWDLVAGLAPGA